ncbi:MAG: DUF5074 domain-containing protein [Saprospiraceae bacterium]
MLALFFSGCAENEPCCDAPLQEYTKGIFVVNEGPWGGTGTISWHNPDTGETQDSLYEKANNGAVLGQFVQSLTFVGDKAYIVVGSANRVVVVDAQTFKFLNTIEGLELPRYFLPITSELAYVSQWGNDGLSGSLAKINLMTNTVETVVPVGHGPEKMLFANGRVYVANSGGYGSDSTIVSFDPYNAVVLNKFEVDGLNPASVAININGLFALCKGNYDPLNPAGAWLSDFIPTTFGLAVAPGSDDLVTSPNGTELYFVGGGALWVYKNNSLQKIADQAAYGLALDPTRNLLYCADAKDFTGLGEVVVYKTDGTKTGSFRAGIAPGEVVILD